MSLLVYNICIEREEERIKQCSCWILIKIISFSIWNFFKASGHENVEQFMAALCEYVYVFQKVNLLSLCHWEVGIRGEERGQWT